MDQLDLALTDTDREARSKRRVESRRRREAILAHGIWARAMDIHQGKREQDPYILCAINADGQWCDWVAGHYGGHNLNRQGPQRRYR